MRKATRLLLLLIHFIPMCVAAQADSIQAQLYLDKAKKLLKENKFDSAAHTHQLALHHFYFADLPYDALSSYWNLYRGWQNRNKTPQLIDTLKTAIKNLPRLPNCKADSSKYAYYLTCIGFLYQDKLGDYLLAKRFYELSYDALNTGATVADSSTVKIMYPRLANIYTRLGDYERARILLKNAIKFGELHQIANLAHNVSDLAIVFFSQNKLDSAAVLLESQKLKTDIDPRLRLSFIETYSQYWLKKAIPELALEVLSEGAPVLEQIAQHYPTAVQAKQAEYYACLAAVHEALDNKSEAIHFYQKSIESWQESLKGRQQGREMAKVAINVARLFLSLDETENAIHYSQLALQWVLPEFEPIAAENPPVHLFKAENVILEALEIKAACLEKTGRLEEALNCYKLIPAAESKLRETFLYENSSLQLLGERRIRLEKAVALARKLYERNKEAQFAYDAFYFSELVRGEMLFSSLAASAAVSFLPQDLREEELDIRARIAYCEQELAIALKQKLPTSQSLQNELFNYKQRYSTLQERINSTYPNYLKMKQDIAVAKAGDVAAMLEDNQALASFFIQNDSLLHVFFFNGGGFVSWRVSPLPTDFYPNADELTGLLGGAPSGSSDYSRIAQISHELYSLLIGPELEHSNSAVSSIVFVPDQGELSFLPFEILLEKPALLGQNFGEMAFLLKTRAISTMTSVTLAKLFKEKFRTGEAAEPFAGFAPRYSGSAKPRRDPNPMPPGIGDMPDLPGARKEVALINELMKGANYSGELATKAAFLENAHRYRTLHLAMHALADRSNPVLGKFIFYEKPGDQEGENILFANQLGNLSLHADLAVLSACDTGTGKWRKGEGVFSLARAFNLAGVPNVVMSLWHLPDSTTPEIMVEFYNKLKQGSKKNEALRLAKLAYLQNHSSQPDQLHPFFWAGLVLSGSGK